MSWVHSINRQIQQQMEVKLYICILYHSISISLKLTSLSEADCLVGNKNSEYFSSLYNVNKYISHIVEVLGCWNSYMYIYVEIYMYIGTST